MIGKRTHILKCRVSRLEKLAIERKAKMSNCSSVAEFLRLTALNKEVRGRLSSEEIDIYKNLSQAKLHFTRISTLIKERKSFTAEVRAVIGLLNEHLNKFKQ